LTVADKYQVLGLKKACTQYILKNVDVHNICTVIRDIENYNTPELFQQCLELIVEHFKEIVNEPNFYELPEHLLLCILKRDFIEMEEIAIFEVVIKWAQKQSAYMENKSGMKNILANISREIRLVSITAMDLKMKVIPSGAIHEDMIIDAFVQRENPQPRPETWLKERGEVLEWLIHEQMHDKVQINSGVLEISSSIQNKAVFTKRNFSSGRLYFEYNITCYSKQRIMLGVGISSQTSSCSWPYDSRDFEKVKIGLLLDFENSLLEAFDSNGHTMNDNIKIGIFILNSTASLFIKTLGRADIYIMRKSIPSFCLRNREAPNPNNNNHQQCQQMES